MAKAAKFEPHCMDDCDRRTDWLYPIEDISSFAAWHPRVYVLQWFNDTSKTQSIPAYLHKTRPQSTWFAIKRAEVKVDTEGFTCCASDTTIPPFLSFTSSSVLQPLCNHICAVYGPKHGQTCPTDEMRKLYQNSPTPYMPLKRPIACTSSVLSYSIRRRAPVDRISSI